jgi:hypothetical protein
VTVVFDLKSKKSLRKIMVQEAQFAESAQTTHIAVVQGVHTNPSRGNQNLQGLSVTTV